MADNTRSLQECKKLEGMILELAEQMRQSIINNAAEFAEIKQAMSSRHHSPAGGEEASTLNGEPVVYAERRRETGTGHNPYSAPTRQTRVDFPRFAGEDLRGWLYRCENFFELDGTPWDMKVKVAAVHLEGKALQWHQMYMQKRVTRQTPHWAEYMQALHIRFGMTVFEDPMAELMLLRQTGELEDCLEKFDILLGRVCLPEEYAISCLLAALKDDIADVVRMHRPKSLLETYALARQQNINIKHARNRSYSQGGGATKFTGSAPKYQQTPSNSFKPNAISGVLPTPKQPGLELNKDIHNSNPQKRLTSTEMDEKRRRRVCFWCDEKFTFEHKCRRRHVHMITIDVLGNASEDEETPGDVDEEPPPEPDPHLSLCALKGEIPEMRCNTMRIEGLVKRGVVNILIDSGSTHNFLDPYVAKRLGYTAEPIDPIFVAVANGEKMVCREVCRRFKWVIQGNEFNADVFLLRLGGCEMVLGVEWLSMLGDILWNFQESTMKFSWEGRELTLQGMTESIREEVEIQALEKMLHRRPITQQSQSDT